MELCVWNFWNNTFSYLEKIFYSELLSIWFQPDNAPKTTERGPWQVWVLAVKSRQE